MTNLSIKIVMIEKKSSSMHREYHKFYAFHVYLRSIRLSLLYTPTPSSLVNSMKLVLNFYACEGWKMWCDVVSPPNKERGEITKHYFYQTLTMYVVLGVWLGPSMKKQHKDVALISKDPNLGQNSTNMKLKTQL